MSINDYQAPKTFATEHAPRERASQDTAAQHRARTPNSELRTTNARPSLHISPRIIIAGGMLLLLAALALVWPGHPLPTPPEPTAAPALAAPTPAPVSTPTIAPIASPAPTQPATAHTESAPPTGRGLMVDQGDTNAVPTPVAPPPTAAPPTATPVPYNPDKPTLAAAIAYPTISVEQAAIINDQTRFTPRDSVPCGPHATRRECLLHDDYTPPTPEVH
jgi:hypothetical protein